MSGGALSAGSGMRISGGPIEVGPRPAPTDASTPAGFPDLLSKMATTNSGPPSQPAISIAEHRPSWGKEMSRVAAAQDEESEGGKSALADLLGTNPEHSVDAGGELSAAGSAPASSRLDATSIEMRGDTYTPLPLPGAVHAAGSAAPTGTREYQSSSEDRGDAASSQAYAVVKEAPRDFRASDVGVSRGASAKPHAFALPPAPTTDAAMPIEAPRDVRASDVGVFRGASEKPHAFAFPPTPTTDAPMPKEAPRDLRAVASGGGIAGPIVSALSQETHISPTVRSPPVQGARDRSGRAIVADGSAEPGQGTERAESTLLPARMGPLPTAKPLGPSPERLPPIAKSPAEQGGSRNAEAELTGTVSATDRTVSGTAHEPSRAAGHAAPPAHQIAGQIVAAAHTIERAEAQSTGALAAAATPTASPVVKVLRLELQPADLGTITIRLSLKEDGLDIRVEAARHDTANLLQRDQDSLAKLLTTAGYRIDGMAIVAAPTDGAGIPDGRSQASPHSSTHQHEGSSQPDSKSSGGRSNPEPDPRASRGNQNDDHDKSRIGRGAGGDLYV